MPPAGSEVATKTNGRRHKFFPAHVRAIADALSHFSKKLADIRFFVRNPMLLRPEHSSLCRIWCIFCAVDIHEIGGSFVCGNAISHLGSNEHLTNLKRFLWKHGGGIDRVDSFRISETELLKWEKGCENLKIAASNEGAIGPVLKTSKDIQFQYELNSSKTDNYEIPSRSYFSSNVSLPVLPLQSYTNENDWLCHPIGNVSSTSAHVEHLSASVPILGNVPLLTMLGKLEKEILRGMQWMFRVLIICKVMLLKQCFRSTVAPMQAQIVLPSDGCQPNVHTGGFPPWLDTSDQHENSLVNYGTDVKNLSLSAQKGKSRKLNPNRVGAAWAEKRRIEIELEKRGEIIRNSVDDNWLPNFGRVWQAGTRKESRKQFEIENHKLLKSEMSSKSSFTLQPYISKRMVWVALVEFLALAKEETHVKRPKTKASEATTIMKGIEAMLEAMFNLGLVLSVGQSVHHSTLEELGKGVEGVGKVNQPFEEEVEGD
ncbi:hypothetical protein HPP92_013148 [Vanilla planifolia]|uniref:TITAN-like protein n=1 Tax=Vanilla planifolia TaxID=51239 RepID=A0A835QTI5_VANPL|nr:hypothetical protein HPP92_013148 [Vanilla planifolia]